MHIMDIDVQTLYSIVNNSISNVLHTWIDWTKVKLPMCHYNLMSCSSLMSLETSSSWCQMFSLFFICGGHIDSFNFCLTIEIQFYCEKLVKISQNGYTYFSTCSLHYIFTTWNKQIQNFRITSSQIHHFTITSSIIHHTTSSPIHKFTSTNAHNPTSRHKFIATKQN
jgi:hypothetical protein